MLAINVLVYERLRPLHVFPQDASDPMFLFKTFAAKNSCIALSEQIHRSLLFTMLCSFPPLVVTASAFLNLVAAAPIDSVPTFQSTAKRQASNGTQLNRAFDSTCWDQLGTAKYLGDPTTGWGATTPKCNDGNFVGAVTTTQTLDTSCCKLDEPWSTYFLRRCGS